MLSRLYISNYAVIDELEIMPGPGLNIITGETGAGKSILLDSLALVFGEKADQSMMRNVNQKVIVEAVFNLSKYNLKSFFDDNELDFLSECILRREISPGGKSRAFVNDTPVTLKILRELAIYLVDVHRQFENTELLEAGYQWTVLDVLSNQTELLDEYRNALKNFKHENAAYLNLCAQKETSLKELEYWKFQLEDLNKVPLIDFDIDSLEIEQKKLENTESIKSKLEETWSILGDMTGSAIDLISQGEQTLKGAIQLNEELTGLHERLHSIRIELKELTSEISNEMANTAQDPERLAQLEEWLGEVYRLYRKHSVQSVEALQQIQGDLVSKISLAENLDDAINEKQMSSQLWKEKALTLAKNLFEGRLKSKEYIELKMHTLLEEVGMKGSVFEVEVQWDGAETNQFGSDHVRFLFSANKGLAARELKKVASGGELSRILLCIKQLISNKVSMPTLVFDEIDTGISGQTALQVANVLEELGEYHQVLVVSHLPQIASRGKVHFHIEKLHGELETVSKIRSLDYENRVSVLAAMLGGTSQNDGALANAKELLSLAKN